MPEFRPSDFGPDCIAVGRASSPFGGMCTRVYRREHRVEAHATTEDAARASYAQARADMERAGVEVVPPEPEPKLEPDLLGQTQIGWRFGIGAVRLQVKKGPRTLRCVASDGGEYFAHLTSRGRVFAIDPHGKASDLGMLPPGDPVDRRLLPHAVIERIDELDRTSPRSVR